MKERNPLEEAINELGNLLQQLQDPTKKMQDLTPENLAELARLEEQAKLFNQATDNALRDNGIDIESLKIEALNSSDISPKEKRFIERANQIQREGQTLKARIAAQLAKTASPKIVDKQAQLTKERKKKFKPLGGNKGWIPM